jgi:acyl-CoA thioesterase-2
VPEQGLEHAAVMPSVPGPEGLPDVRELKPGILEKVPEKMRRFLVHDRPFEFRPVEPIHVVAPPRADPVRHIWIKTVDALPDDPDLHRNVLAYVSDYQLVATATLPHGIHFAEGNVQLASLDHAMWFHRPFRVDDWLLYAMQSPNASGGRGFALGRFFTRAGELVASTAQEGVVRVWR